MVRVTVRGGGCGALKNVYSCDSGRSMNHRTIWRDIDRQKNTFKHWLSVDVDVVGFVLCFALNSNSWSLEDRNDHRAFGVRLPTYPRQLKRNPVTVTEIAHNFNQ